MSKFSCEQNRTVRILCISNFKRVSIYACINADKKLLCMHCACVSIVVKQFAEHVIRPQSMLTFMN